MLLDGVVGDTTQHVHFMHKDEAGNYSLVVTAAAIVVPDYSITFNLTDDLIDGDVLSNIQGNTLINGHNLIITGSIENITSLYKLTIYLTGTSSIGTVINPGTGYGQVNILYPVPVTLTFVDTDTGLPIEGANVIFGTGPGLGEVFDNVLTNALGVVTTSYTGTAPDEVEGFAAKGSEAPIYKRTPITATIAAGSGLTQTIPMAKD
ncbi:MAG: hypothetical protein GY815_07565 [Gammaproteobacteria bacterium]|nr:hypothetical protein [Gammaproteobacteria bacterium]